MRLGTSHFVNVIAALRYYQRQYGEAAGEMVKKKIYSGEIKIGPPRVGPGQKLVLTDGGTRYAIEDGA